MASKRTGRSSDVYTTSDVARVCRVTANTVVNWIDRGRLRAFRTPGGHRRVRREDLLRFLDETGMDLGRFAGDAPRPRVLVVAADPATTGAVERLAGGPERAEVRVARDAFEAGFLSAQFRPDVLLLDPRTPGVDGVSLCRRLKADPLRRGTVVVALAPDADDEARRLVEAGVAECLARPLDVAALGALLDRLVRGDGG